MINNVETHEYFCTIVNAQDRGIPLGIPSICSANSWVVEAALVHGLGVQAPVLIESTCNQVNQYGGYTGMIPAEFATHVRNLATKVGFSEERLLLGGDHLGPSPWQDQPAEKAMNNARDLVAKYVENGFCKIHLDASMPLVDEACGQPLSRRIAASRAADLAEVAELTYENTDGLTTAPRYVIGTEVPIPGGIQEADREVEVSRPRDVQATVDTTREEFLSRGLEDAWSRVIAVVVEPGVEFGDSVIYDYDRETAKALKDLIEGYSNLVYEAHSTDYQTRQALRDMVEDHFAILKVGPALTFAFREAIFSLSMIEEELLESQDGDLSNVRQLLEEEMLANPVHWEEYYSGDKQQLRLARQYSFSDRSRYYWAVPRVHSALETLVQNLSSVDLPLSLLSQFFPLQYERVRRKELKKSPTSLILGKIETVIEDYYQACRAGILL